MANDERTEGGQPILRHEDTRSGWTPAQSVGEANYRALEMHYEKHFGGSSSVFHELVSDLVHIDVYLFPANEQRKFHVLATIGMSALPMTTPADASEYRFAELLIDEESLKDEANYFPIHWMKYLARMPHIYQTWLGYGHTIPNGDPPQPMTNTTSLCGVVLLPPILFGDSCARLEKEDGTLIHIWAVVPLYAEEMDLKLKRNVEALFEGFEKHQVNELLNLQRVNTVKPEKPKGFLQRLFGN
jgi:Suppressor of fused protein (SUFU)